MLGQQSARGDLDVLLTSNRRQWLTRPSPDQPLVLLVASQKVVGELLARPDCPFYFGASTDPASGIGQELRDAVRRAKHPVDLLRQLGHWADDVQRAVPRGQVATCWHPAVSAAVLRQATRYPVHVIEANSADEAITWAASLGVTDGAMQLTGPSPLPA